MFPGFPGVAPNYDWKAYFQRADAKRAQRYADAAYRSAVFRPVRDEHEPAAKRR